MFYMRQRFVARIYNNLYICIIFIFHFFFQEGFAPPDEVEGVAGEEDEY